MLFRLNLVVARGLIIIPMFTNVLLAKLLSARLRALNPAGCPTNPSYTTSQTNTFIFDNLVNNFFVDFNAFSSHIVGCPRMQVKINGIFYFLTAANLVELPAGTTCMGLTNILTVTADGYITTGSIGSTINGQGRLVFNGVNATSITFSTNDEGGGTVFANPCAPIIVPVKLKHFTGKEGVGCKAILSWESEIESSVKNIEVFQSVNGSDFRKIAEVIPGGSYTSYKLEVNNHANSFFKLKIIDLDGYYECSKTIKVKSNCYELAYNVYPNPTRNFIEIESLKKDDKIFILDVLGRNAMIFSSLPNGSKFNIEKLPAGLYNLRIINNGKIKALIKFVKSE